MSVFFYRYNDEWKSDRNSFDRDSYVDTEKNRKFSKWNHLEEGDFAL